MFNLHEIEDDYDVFVAFETMKQSRQASDKSGTAQESSDLPDNIV